MSWFRGCGWDSVETSFPYYSWFPFASHRGFELFLSKRRLLVDVSACNLFHKVSPHAWVILFPFLSTKPVHPLIQLQPFIAGFLTDSQQTILFSLQMISVLAPWILELHFYASYKDKRTVFFSINTHWSSEMKSSCPAPESPLCFKEMLFNVCSALARPHN